jgi:integrase
MTIHKRDSGHWGWERKHRLLPDGRIRISLRTKDRKEATRRARALDLLLERGEVGVLQRIRAGDLHVVEAANAVRDEAVDALRGSAELDLSLGASLERVKTEKAATRSKGTRAMYLSFGGALVKALGKDRQLYDISSDELRAWLYGPKGKARKPWAANSQRNAAMVAGRIWRLAIELEAEAAHRVGVKPRITRDPWASIEINDRAQPRVAFLEPHEWKDVLNATEGRPEAAFLATLCLAGLRIGEARLLRTGIDVDLDAGLLRIQSREGEHGWTTKGDRSQRDVPIPNALKELLATHLASGFAGERYFFHSARWDKPVSYSIASLYWVKASIERAGLKYGRNTGDLTAHSLRHSFASWLVREGWSYALVAKLMGNSAAEVEKTYSHLAPDDLRKVVATIDVLAA